MKKLLIATINASLLFASAAIADERDGHSHSHSPSQDMKQQAKEHPKTFFMVAGIVQETDPANGSVTIAHQAVPALKWPAMTKSFAVTDKTLFSRLKVGEKAEFAIKLVDGKAVVAHVKTSAQ